MQAVAVAEALAAGGDDFSEAEAIAELQARVSFVGPVTGFLAAQQAAKNNRIYVSERFTGLLDNHIQEIENEYHFRYPTPPWGSDPVQTWQEYADMLRAVASDGIAADAENRRFFLDYTDESHLLLNPSFYDAIASRDWCWFYFNAMDVLSGYTGYTYWDDLPMMDEPEPMNSEYFGLMLRKVSQLDQLPQLTSGLDVSDLNTLVQTLETLSGQTLPTEWVETPASWFCFRDRDWSSWSAFIGNEFPFYSEIKPQYNYRGADAATRIEASSPRLTPGSGINEIRWTAAAKPFGSLDQNTPPSALGLVLPVFEDVRLIPVDSSSAPAGGSRPGWGEFIYLYLPLYMQRGPSALPNCWYCQQLQTWEDPSFRNQGITWLNNNSARCRQSAGGGGGGGGGGTRRGH